MFNSGCCGCRYGEQSAGREGGRRKDQEGGLAGSERVAAVSVQQVCAELCEA